MALPMCGSGSARGVCGCRVSDFVRSIDPEGKIVDRDELDLWTEEGATAALQSIAEHHEAKARKAREMLAPTISLEAAGLESREVEVETEHVPLVAYRGSGRFA